MLKAFSDFFRVRKDVCVRKSFTQNTIIVLRNENLDTSNLALGITKPCPCWENVGGFMFVSLTGFICSFVSTELKSQACSKIYFFGRL